MRSGFLPRLLVEMVSQTRRPGRSIVIAGYLEGAVQRFPRPVSLQRLDS
jgi:hypothetical protein